ncbi:MAG: hypothetical protein KGI56_09275 [Acidobacteriota bacterium]|nr:hypothetical protein [Acidobacteriota bacterium]
MAEVISSKQLGILALIAKNAGAPMAALVKAGASEADVAYLVQHDMIREQREGGYRIAHFGELVLRRGI